MAALIDPTARGKYPVILGDGMLGKTSNDIFTGVRYNHKPSLSSADAPAHARLKPSQPGKTTSYDLSYNDGGAAYAYAGTRTIDTDQFVLHFDPDRKAFILDRIDSTFNMNLTRLPGTSDSAKLARQYPHLDAQRSSEAKPAAADSKPHAPSPAPPAASPAPPPPPPPASAPPSRPAGSGNASAKSAKTSTAKGSTAKSAAVHPPRRKADKPQQKAVGLSLPKPEPTPPPPPPPPPKTKAPPKPAQRDEDEDEDDGDGGLLVEYPGGNNTTAKMTDFSPAFPPPRRFDDFMDQRDSEGDADEESDGELDLDFKLPSPVNNPPPGASGNLQRRNQSDSTADAGAADDAASADMEDDLEKELENAFEDLANSQEGTPDGGDESEISEED
ncbi:hypothetical protein XA68_11987 [Ophiocordyceps unilateralis]|uniref:Transcription elongation factor Eaf N-terminal domain-containing protein n=1 Tax=Ophiocordyceps unilateralis TaxID=268505 RepID=A0A2A9PNG1_OPHUN|nr:hypothetical protein XA68_11987 [Ophiocordyceps unilateralis]